MHWNVAPDALYVSATLVRVLDRWPNDCTFKAGVCTYTCLTIITHVCNSKLFAHVNIYSI